ncbi:aminotransferase class I/II-fold pyridoxal phosphate-dependent enzyme [bacterium]|nr:MAG: aminotransferase class I/II-fold pyridoxal phosphate-dependent enzyme [bacterium]
MAEIPSLVPFVAPEALEAKLGVRFRLRLGANESAFGPSPLALTAMRDAIERGSWYGDPQSMALRTELAAHLGVTVEHLVVTSGIDEGLALFCRAFLNPGDVAATTLGSYPTFEFGARGAGARLERAGYQNDAPDLDALHDLVRQSGAKLVYLANPDNPSGALLPAHRVESFRASLPSDCLLLLDEAYADFVPLALRPTFSPDDPGVVRFRTFSKAHGLAGLRVGYAIAAPETVAALDKIRMHFGVNAVGQAGALASLKDPGHLNRVIQETLLQRTRLAEIGTRVGVRPLPSATNFVTFATENREEAEGLLDRLLQRGVFIRKPGAPPLDRCVRISVGRPEELDLLEEILQQIV